MIRRTPAHPAPDRVPHLFWTHPLRAVHKAQTAHKQKTSSEKPPFAITPSEGMGWTCQSQRDRSCRQSSIKQVAFQATIRPIQPVRPIQRVLISEEGTCHVTVSGFLHGDGQRRKCHRASCGSMTEALKGHPDRLVGQYRHPLRSRSDSGRQQRASECFGASPPHGLVQQRGDADRDQNGTTKPTVHVGPLSGSQCIVQGRKRGLDKIAPSQSLGGLYGRKRSSELSIGPATRSRNTRQCGYNELTDSLRLRSHTVISTN